MGQSCLHPALSRPLCQYRRRLTLLGTGVTDYPDILVDPQESISPIVEHLRQSDVDFSDLRPTSPLLAAIASPTERSSVSPVLTLPVAGRAGLRRQRARLSRQGEVHFETATPATFDEYLDALVKLHQARWTGREQPGVFGAGPMTAFLRDAGRALLRTGLLRFHGLRLDGTLIATLFSFLSRNTSYFYLSGFDPALAAFSPGALLIESAIRDAAACGATEVDFLRGAEPYKYAWGARDRINLRMRWSSTERRAA